MTSPYESGVISNFSLGANPFQHHPFIDALAWPGFMWGTGEVGGAGTGTVITYSFPTADATWAADYANGEPSNDFVPFSAAQQDAVRQALAVWSEYANITFVEVTETESEVGDFRFGNSSAVTGASQAYMPVVDGVSDHPESGDIWLNTQYEGNQQLQPGQEGFAVLLQAIGRALGLDDPALDHPGDPNEVAWVGQYAELDTGKYSIMASVSEPNTPAFASTPQMADILAIQYIYGRNMNTRTGDDVYQFSANGQVNMTIWDAGGIDTFDLSNQVADMRIELWGASHSQIFLQDGTVGLIGIDMETHIENAIGGSGNDIVYGNELNNHLQGGEGNDHSSGFEGDDIVEGGAGDDDILGYYGNDTLDGGTGIDRMSGQWDDDVYVVDHSADQVIEYIDEGFDTIESTVSYALAADSYVEVLKLVGTGNLFAGGNAEANMLIGNAGKNLLTGGAGADTLDGGAGADALVGGAGNDTYVINSTGDAINEELNKDSGDIVHSTISVNLAMLGAGAVELAVLLGTAAIKATGSSADNELVGNDGANVLDGAEGADTLTGGAGNDTYVVDNVGDQVIEDAAGGIDTVKSFINFSLVGLANVENLVLASEPGNLDGTGNDLDNKLTGSEAGNRLDGGAGKDTMAGGANDDYYIVDNTGDVVRETITNADGGGIDTVESSVSYSLATNVDHLVLTGADNLNGTGNGINNTLTGNVGDNKLNGGAGDDLLVGGDGNDTLLGGLGFDLLQAGDGSDRMTGGELFDTFIFSRVSELGDLDVITGFVKGEDWIDIGDLLDDASYAGSDIFGDGILSFTYDNSTTNIWFDADGSAGAGSALSLVRVQKVTLTSTDNVFIV